MRSAEGLLVLRIRNCFFPAKSRELCRSSAPNRFDKPRISVAREVLKRSRLPVLLSHKEQRNERREQSNSGGKFQRLKPNERCEAVSRSAMPDLVVILTANDESIGRQAIR